MTTPDRDAIRRRWEAPTPDYGVRMSKMAPSQYAATQALADDLMQARKDIAALLSYTERLEKAVEETAKLCRDAVEEIGIREAAHGHGVTSGPNYTPTDADYEAAKKGCWFCIRVEVLDEAVRAIDAALARREGANNA